MMIHVQFVGKTRVLLIDGNRREEKLGIHTHYTASEILSDMECRMKETNLPKFTGNIDCVDVVDIIMSQLC